MHCHMGKLNRIKIKCKCLPSFKNLVYLCYEWHISLVHTELHSLGALKKIYNSVLI